MGAIDLFMWATPNGYKISIMLEETGLPYRVVPIDIGKGEQFTPDFLRISPNNKIPAITDPEGPDERPISLFESGAILIYLANKSGRFLSPDPRRHYEALQWLMWQMGGQGPMLGQAHHFRHYAPNPIEYAIDRYTSEAARLYGVMERRLTEVEYLAGEYSVADIAAFPWVRRHQRHGQDLDDYPAIRRWHDAIAKRPAVIAGLKPLAEGEARGIVVDDRSRALLFGTEQFRRR